MILHTDIVGKWDINRSIRDIINKKEFKLSGSGIFTNKNNIFHYKETGLLISDKFESKAHQEYTWIIKPNGWIINFSDGNHFHDLELENTEQEVYHECGNDIYKGMFLLNLPRNFEVMWEVSGPRKNYKSHTYYNKEIGR